MRLRHSHFFLAVLARLLLACGGAEEHGDASRVQADEAGAPLDAPTPQDTDPARDAAQPRLELPQGRWVQVAEDDRATAWETRIVYDPRARRVVQHGGHVPGSYVQSNYTALFDPRTGAIEDARAPWRPQRRCIVASAWVSSLGEMLTAHGGSDHGSLPIGALASDGTRVRRTDAVGPWLYDSIAARWEDARPPGAPWVRSAHSPMAYDPGSDAVFTLVGDNLVVYSVHDNSVVQRALPEALHNRLAYAIAVEPSSRTLVVFGGTGPLQWTWASDRVAAYHANVRRDTWLYDIGADTWRELGPVEAPARGLPMLTHLELPMVHHPPSGTLLLLQTPTNEPLTPEERPPTELWRFEVATQSWARVPMEAPLSAPGVLAYASDDDVLVHMRAGVVHLARVEVPGFPTEAPAPLAVRVERGAALALSWDATPGRRYVVERSLAAPIPEVFEEVATVDVGAYSEREATDRFAYRVRELGGRAVSDVVFATPRRPRGLRAVVEAPTRVSLRWDAPPESGVVAWHVHRARGGSTTRIATVMTPSFVDESAELDDGIVRRYWVRAVTGSGLQGGPSNVAYTVPDPVSALRVEDRGESLVVSWEPDEGAAGVQLWVHDRHVNTLGMSSAQVQAYWDEWRLATPEPVAPGVVIPLGPADPARPHRYVYARGVNRLGQLGFYSDISSASDARFRADP